MGVTMVPFQMMVYLQSEDRYVLPMKSRRAPRSSMFRVPNCGSASTKGATFRRGSPIRKW